MIGREEEIALLTRRWEWAKAGDGSVVLIAGEPGIGKSRVAQTLLEQLGKGPHTRLRYFCSPHYQNSALYPSIAQLERAAGFLHASLLALLDRLAPIREVAQIGSALGRSFSHELIVAVAAMPQDKLNDALDQLVTAELIFRRGTPPDAGYTFKHALEQDAAYGTLLRGSRQLLHGRIADAMLSRSDSEQIFRFSDQKFAL